MSDKGKVTYLQIDDYDKLQTARLCAFIAIVFGVGLAAADLFEYFFGWPNGNHKVARYVAHAAIAPIGYGVWRCIGSAMRSAGRLK
jgi:hypothetical protein